MRFAHELSSSLLRIVIWELVEARGVMNRLRTLLQQLLRELSANLVAYAAISYSQCNSSGRCTAESNTVFVAAERSEHTQLKS